MDKQAREAFEKWCENYHRNTFRYSRHDYKRDLVSFTAGWQAASQQNNGWQTIDKIPDDVTVMLGHWNEVDKRWYWQTTGAYDAELNVFYSTFTDEEIIWTDSATYQKPTHFKLFEETNPPKEIV